MIAWHLEMLLLYFKEEKQRFIRHRRKSIMGVYSRSMLLSQMMYASLYLTLKHWCYLYLVTMVMVRSIFTILSDDCLG